MCTSCRSGFVLNGKKMFVLFSAGPCLTHHITSPSSRLHPTPPQIIRKLCGIWTFFTGFNFIQSVGGVTGTACYHCGKWTQRCYQSIKSLKRRCLVIVCVWYYCGKSFTPGSKHDHLWAQFYQACKYENLLFIQNLLIRNFLPLSPNSRVYIIANGAHLNLLLSSIGLVSA